MKTIDLMARSFTAQHLMSIQTSDAMDADQLWGAVEAIAKKMGSHVMSVLPLAAWADRVFPVVRLSHSLASQLILTEPPREEELQAPWSVFLVEVPNGFVSIGRHEVSHVLVTHQGDRFLREVYFADTEVSILQRNRFGEDACGIEVAGDTSYRTDITIDETNRAFEVLDTLVANICWAGTSPGKGGPGGTLTREEPLGRRVRGVRRPCSPRGTSSGAPSS
jgi:hypothetical protein